MFTKIINKHNVFLRTHNYIDIGMVPRTIKYVIHLRHKNTTLYGFLREIEIELRF